MAYFKVYRVWGLEKQIEFKDEQSMTLVSGCNRETDARRFARCCSENNHSEQYYVVVKEECVTIKIGKTPRIETVVEIYKNGRNVKEVGK